MASSKRMMMQTTAWHLGFVTIVVSMASAAAAANPDHVQQVKQTGSCPNCELSHADLQNLELENADLSHANLSHVHLSGANLRKANLKGANLTATNLTATNLRGAQLQGAFSQTTCDVIFADLAQLGLYAVLNQSKNSDQALICSLAEMVDLARIIDVPLKASSENVEMPGLVQGLIDQLRKEDIWLDRLRTRFYKANLQGANLTDVRLEGADFRAAELEGANLSNANLSNALFFDTSLGDIKPASLKSNYIASSTVRRELQRGIDQMHARLQTQATQAIELGGRSTVGYILRAQQAFYLEHERFALDIGELQVDVNRFSTNYRFKLLALKASESDALPSRQNRAVWIAARPHQPQWQSYIGLVWRSLEIPTFSFGNDQLKPFTLSIMCRSNQPLAPVLSPPRLNNQGLHRSDAMCPQGYSLVK